MKTEKELWRLIETANWEDDHDYDRIATFYKKELNDKEFKELEDFARNKGADLYDKFEQDWLGKPGISVGDDSWSDLLAEVVGRGEIFYNSITAVKLRKMVKNRDFEENFFYSFHLDNK